MFFERKNLLLSVLQEEELGMSNMYDLEKVDQSFEASSRAKKSSKMRGVHRTVNSIITNIIVARVKRESFFV